MAEPVAVSLYDAKTNLSRLVDEAAAGSRFTITKNGRPLAMLVPLQDLAPARRLGGWGGVVDLPEDFDAPMDPPR
jgi:prevent-host-death family protein